MHADTLYFVFDALVDCIKILNFQAMTLSGIILASTYKLWRTGSKQRGKGGYNESSSFAPFLFAHFCSPLTLKGPN